MKYFSIYGGLDKELFDPFVSFCNENQNEPLGFIMNTAGGSWYNAEMMIHMINSLPDALIIVQAAYSAGFYMLTQTKCKKILSNQCRGMLHCGRWETTLTDTFKLICKEDQCMKSDIGWHSKFITKIARNIMTKEEFLRFKKNEDVFFSVKRMKQIFPNAKML